MTYSVGDVFLGCPASFTGRPYNQPTVLHYASDGTTLLHTLTVPVGPATNEEYQVYSVVVGTDGRCYVHWGTTGNSISMPTIPANSWLTVFDADGVWVADIVDLTFTVDTGHNTLLALPGGDIALLTAVSTVPTIFRYQNDGTLVNSWAAPGVPSYFGFALQPGSSMNALLLSNDQAYVVSLLDGSTVSGPVTIPYDPMNEAPWALLASQTAPYLVIGDYSASNAVWRIQQLTADMTSVVGARAQLAAEDFPGGGINHYGLINPPRDSAVNSTGNTGWCVSYTVDTSHTGDPSDSLFRTDVRTTAIPGGTSSAVQTDVNGDTNLVYVFQGFASPPSSTLFPFVSMVG